MTGPAAPYLRDGVTALVVTAAAAGACVTVWWLGLALAGGPSASVVSAMVLATVVALSLGRRTFASRSEFARSALALPVVGLAAGAVGWLLVAVPPLGAALFVAGMSIPIWLRRFGPRASGLGALIALPLTAMLVAPVVPAPGAPAWLTAVMVLLAGAVASAWVAIAREVLLQLPGRLAAAPAARASGAPASPAPATPAPSAPTSATPPPTASPSVRRLPASTRMAIQMAVALAAAFAVGWLVFPDHVMWVVLTAFLVCSGNRGRADVLHKSALRILGALGGTVAAVALALAAPHASGSAAVVLIFVVLFAGTWLRSYSYAFWALAVTLVLSLLQQLTGVATLTGETGMLAERMLAIVVGAALGIAASWFVLPVRSVDVLRRRLSEALAALGVALTVEPGDATGRVARVAAFREAVGRVEQLSPAHRAARLLPRRRGRGPLAIDCIEAVGALPAALDSYLARRAEQPELPEQPELRESARREDRLRVSIGRARRSLRAPVELTELLSGLRDVEVALCG